MIDKINCWAFLGGKMNYSYQSEKLSSARCALMLPHTSGEAQSIANAFHECSLAFHNLNENVLGDDSARNWVLQLKELMNTDGLNDPNNKGTWFVKAETLDVNQKLTLSRAVDELASWFASHA
jgi:hypothetical protein